MRDTIGHVFLSEYRFMEAKLTGKRCDIMIKYVSGKCLAQLEYSKTLPSNFQGLVIISVDHKKDFGNIMH